MSSNYYRVQLSSTSSVSEEMFWDKDRLLESNQFYGTDTTVHTKTYFDDTCQEWNLGTFKSVLNYLNNGNPVPGINESYVYFGTTYSKFPLHIENMDTYSINYHHEGANKIW